MKIMRAVIVAMLLIGSAGWVRSTAGKSPKPVPTLREQIIGTWKLDRRVLRKPDGTEATMPGWDGAIGYITYDRTGFMSVQLMQLNRAKDSPLGTYAAYFGPYTVDESKQTVTHHIIGNINPGTVGASEDRQITVEGNKMAIHIRNANSPDMIINYMLRMDEK